MLGFCAISQFAISQVVAGAVSIAVPAGDPGLTFLVEGQYHNGSAAVSYYLSGGAEEGFTSLPGDNPADTYFEPRIVDPGNFERHLFAPGSFRGKSQVGSGDIVVASGDPGTAAGSTTLDAWLGYGFSGRPIVIKAMKREWTSYAQALTLFTGKASRLAATNPLERFEIGIRDALSDLDKPLLTTVFAGTTTSSAATAEGNADLKGQIKQQVWGQASNVPCQPANVYDLIYHVSLVSSGGLTSITVYDGGVALTNAGDEANISALRSATIAPGAYKTCLAAGLIRLGHAAEKAVTADVLEGANAAARTAGQIAKRMLTGFGISENIISAAAIADLDTKNSAVCYAFVNDATAAADAIQKVLDSIGAWMVPNRFGIYEFGRFEAPVTDPNQAFDLSLQSIGDTLDLQEIPIPVYRVTLKWGEVHHVQGEADVFGAVTAERRATLASQFRSVVAEDTSIKTKHLDAIEIEVETNLASGSDAATEVSRLLTMLKADRAIYRVTVPLDDAWPIQVGSSVLLTHTRLGMSSGLPFRVLSRVDNYERETITLTVWG